MTHEITVCNHSLPPPDSQQLFSGFKAQFIENTPFGATLSAAETLQKPVGCQGV